MFNIILKRMGETVSDEFCILSKERRDLRLLLVHISHIFALKRYAVNLSCLCRTQCLTADINYSTRLLECFKDDPDAEILSVLLGPASDSF